MIPRLTCRNVTRYTRNFTLTLTHIMNVHNCSFFGPGRIMIAPPLRVEGARVSPLACAPFTGSARTELIRTFAPFTRPAPHKFSQPNRLTLHPATNRNQSDIHTRPAPVWT